MRDRIERLLTLEKSELPLLNRTPQSLLSDFGSDERGSTTTTSPVDLVVSSLEPSADSELGNVNHYRVDAVLGHGGFGVVLKAFDRQLHRNVAIKVLSPMLAATSGYWERFLREARAAAKVFHTNVVQIFEVRSDPIPHIVMEYVEGESLHDYVQKRGPLEPQEVVRIGRQLAEGLAAAHDAGIVHRDIKPANVLLQFGTEMVAKIADFGLAVADFTPDLTKSSQMIGTPPYMSPEQAQGEELDHRTDLFSLGSVLSFMCTAAPPFEAQNALAILRDVAAARSRELPTTVPAGLASVIDRLHARRPSMRFQSALELDEKLASCVGRKLILRRRTKWLIAIVASVAVTTIGFAATWPDIASALGMTGTVPTAKLVHQWSFEGNFDDTSGSENHGRLVGGDEKADFTVGRHGWAIDLNSDEGVVDLDATNLPLRAEDEWTMNVWMNFDETPVNFGYLAGFGIQTEDRWGQARGILHFHSTFNFWGSGSTSDRGSDEHVIADGDWHMYTVVREQGLIRLFINGQLVSWGAVTLADIERGRVQVGNPSIWTSKTRGKLDEFTIWDGAMSPSEVRWLYHSTPADRCEHVVPSNS